MKEQWVPLEETKEDVASYIATVHRRMLEARKIVGEHLKQEQQKQKSWYDKEARELNHKKGDQVLFLQPDSSAKFTKKWQGPFKVQKKLGWVNYEIEINNYNTKVCHVNLLLRWFPTGEPAHHYVNVIEEDSNMELYEQEIIQQIAMDHQLEN